MSSLNEHDYDDALPSRKGIPCIGVVRECGSAKRLLVGNTTQQKNARLWNFAVVFEGRIILSAMRHCDGL